MKEVLDGQQVSANISVVAGRRSWKMSATLWSVQTALALIFLFAGGMKLILPVEAMLAQMPLPLPGLFVHFIGIVEVAGALGLIFPALLRIRPALTALAAWELFIEMLVATGYTILGGQGASAITPLLMGLLSLFVAYARRDSLLADPFFARLSRRSNVR
jgi:hypothetical protein